MPGYTTSGTCWTAGGSPSSQTSSRSPMPWLGCLNCGRHANPGSCPTWRSIPRTSATSPGQPTWWLILSPGRPGRLWLCRHASSPTCTWTWLGLYQLLQRGTRTCSPSLTGQPGGLKQFLWETRRPARAWMPSSPAGWDILACRGLSPRIGGHSSHLPCGLLPARAWASSTCSQQPTIQRVMAWLSACTGSSRMPYVHVEWVSSSMGVAGPTCRT